jgi:alpha-L-fucosidase
MFRTAALTVLAGAVICLAAAWCVGAEKVPVPAEKQTQMDPAKTANMQWWREARFGMFIHWGVYSVPAGTYHGKKIPGIGEWIMLKAKIPVAEYRHFAKEFNPVKYDADAWVRLAKEAGMKYIVITSKHHEGFALFDSKATDWDVVDATPYGKDLLRPLEQACKKHGMKLGFYYSQAQDWTHPGGAKSGYEEGTGWDEAHLGSFDEYLAKIAYPQVKEILSNYDIDVLWWDTPRWMTKERADRLLPLLALRPGIVWNNRLGGDYKGCFSTPEQRIPDTGLDYDWETCMTMNNTWGYKSYDQKWKSTEKLVRNLVDIASKGGNYLLNVGPTKEGEIPEPSIERLKEIGRWMKVNGESIYGTTASPFPKPAWGRYTKKPGVLYAHVFDWPKDGTLSIPLAGAGVKALRLLSANGPVALTFDKGEKAVTVHLPAEAPDTVDSVVVVEHGE